jgi:hypothetical protein
MSLERRVAAGDLLFHVWDRTFHLVSIKNEGVTDFADCVGIVRITPSASTAPRSKNRNDSLKTTLVASASHNPGFSITESSRVAHCAVIPLGAIHMIAPNPHNPFNLRS